MATTHKVAEVLDPRHNDYLLIIHDSREKWNPCIIYRKWYDNGWHRRKVTAYADIASAVSFIADVLVERVRL